MWLQPTALADPCLDACHGEGSPRGCHMAQSHPGDVDGDADCWARLPRLPPTGGGGCPGVKGPGIKPVLIGVCVCVDVCVGALCSAGQGRMAAAALWRVPGRLVGMLGLPAGCHLTGWEMVPFSSEEAVDLRSTAHPKTSPFCLPHLSLHHSLPFLSFLRSLAFPSAQKPFPLISQCVSPFWYRLV